MVPMLNIRRSFSLALLFVLALSGCAVPGVKTTIPAEVFVAIAGGDASKLPPGTPPIVYEAHWYDREMAFQVQDGRTGGDFFFDFASSSDATNALEARRSDNDRARANVDGFMGLLQQLGAAAAASQGIGTAPPRGAPPDPDVAARVASLEQLVASLVAEIQAARAPPSPAVTSTPEVSPSPGGP